MTQEEYSSKTTVPMPKTEYTAQTTAPQRDQRDGVDGYPRIKAVMWNLGVYFEDDIPIIELPSKYDAKY